MDTWDTLSSENWSASRDLLNGKHWRSSASRSYYAVYALATSVLLSVGVTMTKGREGPSHKLADLIVNHLISPKTGVQWELFIAVTRLYDLRIIADYQPSRQFGDADARMAHALMIKVVQLLKKEARNVDRA